MVADPRFFPRAGRANDPSASLSLAERDRRWNALRAVMDARGIDCLFVWGKGVNYSGAVRWLDNGDFADRTMIFPRRGDPVTTRPLPSWGKWYTDICWEGVKFQGVEGRESHFAAQAITDYGYQNGVIGIVGLSGAGNAAEGVIPFLTFDNLRRLLPGATFCDASDILVRLRMLKSDEELARVEKACEIANIETDAALRHARPGLRESELYAEMHYAGLKAGADSGRDWPTILCSGKEDYPSNRRQTDRIMRSGDLIQFGIYTRFAGYWSHPHLAISLGALDDEYVPLREAVVEGTQAALAALKPGTPWADVERLCDEPVLRRGYYHEITQLHATGLDGIEPPVTRMVAGNVPQGAPWRGKKLAGAIADNPEWQALNREHGGKREPLTVQPGMVLCLEVKAATADRLYFECGPQVIITASGPRIMNPDAMDVIEL